MHVLSVLYNEKFCFQLNSGFCYVNSFSFSCSDDYSGTLALSFLRIKKEDTEGGPIRAVQMVRVHIQVNQMRKNTAILSETFIFSCVWTWLYLIRTDHLSLQAHLLKENQLSLAIVLLSHNPHGNAVSLSHGGWLTVLCMCRSFRWKDVTSQVCKETW